MNYIETNCTVEHNGRTFEAGGAVVTDDRLIAYPNGTGNLQTWQPLCDWHGKFIGQWRVISSRPAVFFGHRSWQGSRYYYMRAKLKDGRQYSLRGFGVGMVAKGKRLKENTWPIFP